MSRKDLQTQPGTQCLTQAEDLPASDKSKLQFRPGTEEHAELLCVFIEKSLHVSKWLQRGSCSVSGPCFLSRKFCPVVEGASA